MVPRLVKAGKTVALAEGGRFGGTCVNYGCTPTKTIVASARAAHMARRGADFGVMTGEISIDFAKVMQRQNKLRHGASRGLENWLRGLDNVDVYMFTTFMYTKQSYKLFRKAVLTHPTVAELMPWILDDLKPLT